ncbi:MAG: sucrose-specific PTS transporter subunit IIBC [Erysipelotrichaceae bacterium]|nr:sucrose-specific PTS transporter subunit IIBC [Erysipelotrichaceae bacterium]
MDYSKIAKSVIENVGGQENIISAVHCATRLRLRLKDYNKVNEDKITDIDQVKGVFLANDQYQIILGSGTVNLVTDEVLKQTHLSTNTNTEEPKAAKEGNPIMRFVKVLSDIFVPIIPAIVAGGLLMGINNVLTANGLFVAGKSLIDIMPEFAGVASFINLCANAPFTFLPVLIGFSATKKFGGNPYLGAAMGMIMVHPELLNAYSLASAEAIPTWNWFGLEVQSIGYQGTVLPVLMVSWILANLEKRLHRITPSWLDNLTTPLLSILITSVLTFLFVGPAMRTVGDWLAYGLSWMYSSLGFIGGAIFGLLYAPITITGMHHSFSAIETQLIAAAQTTGGSFIFPTASMNNVAQGAAVLAVLFITKDEKLKSICSASGISALLGITEPAMFGVTLKLKYPFYAAIIGSAVGSAWIAGTHTLALAMGAAGLPGFISIAPQSWVNFFIGLGISMATSFILTLVFTKHQANKEKQTKEQQPQTTETTDAIEEQAQENVIEQAQNNTVYAPFAGTVKPLDQCGDEAFASKAMGDGFVITPTDNNFYSPVTGEVSFIFPTRHALGLQTENGTQMLIHIGMDTVNLEGKPFEMFIKQGDKVQAGQLLGRVDFEQIKVAGLSIETPVVITNKPLATPVNASDVNAGQQILTLE